MITDCGCSLIDQTIGILRLLSQLSVKDSEPLQKLSDSNDFALREVIDWTEKNLAGHITLSEVAQHFGYSKNYFCERFRRAAGATYVTYLNLLRVSHSLALLAAGESLSSVCAACGFTNESYYIRLFKSIIGMTPASWKRQTRPQ